VPEGAVLVCSWLISTLQSLAAARLEYGTNRTFGDVSAAVGRRADVPSAGLDRLVVTLNGLGEFGIAAQRLPQSAPSANPTCPQRQS
jgi:hypothetical protein